MNLSALTGGSKITASGTGSAVPLDIHVSRIQAFGGGKELIVRCWIERTEGCIVPGTFVYFDEQLPARDSGGDVAKSKAGVWRVRVH